MHIILLSSCSVINSGSGGEWWSGEAGVVGDLCGEGQGEAGGNGSSCSGCLYFCPHLLPACHHRLFGTSLLIKAVKSTAGRGLWPSSLVCGDGGWWQ